VLLQETIWVRTENNHAGEQGTSAGVPAPWAPAPFDPAAAQFETAMWRDYYDQTDAACRHW
jgi:hypothetical protein